MAQAGTVWVDVRGDTTKFMRDISDGARIAGDSISAFARSGAKTVLHDVGTMATVAGVAVAGIGAAAIKTNTDFSAAMSGVGAVADASADEMETLRQAALKAGADTVFSASQAADAEAELVKAGVSVADVLGGALTGSLSLAAAGQLDLADAATISAQAMNLFGLGGDQVSHIADVLAAGANKSAADVSTLGDALRQGGLVAAQTGLSLEDTVGVLSLFADNALIGSDAGTSFKTMLQRLTPQSDSAKRMMDELGLSFFDAQGQFVGIAEVAGQLNHALAGLSDEQRNTALTTMFGSDAVRAASILVQRGREGVDEYTAAVNDMGAAQRMASAQTDNLKGDIEAFSGSIETSLINLGDMGDEALRGIVQAGTDLVNVFNDFSATPAWDAIGRNIREITSGTGGMLHDLTENLSNILSGIDPAKVDHVFDEITSGVSTLREAVKGAEGVVAGLGISLAGLGARSVLGPLGAFVPTISPITGVLGGMVLGSDRGREALVKLGKKADDFARGPGADLLKSLSELASELGDDLSQVLEDVGTALFDAAEVLGPVFGDAIEELGPPIGDLVKSLGELTSAALPVLADLVGSVLPPMVDVLGVGLSVAADAVGFLADNVWLLVPALTAFTAIKYGDAISGIGTFVKEAGGIGKALEGLVTGGMLKVDQTLGNLKNTLMTGFTPALIGVTAAVTAGVGIYEAWSRNVKRVDDETKQLTESLLEQASDVLPSLARALRNILDTRKGFADAFDAAGLSIEGVSRIVNDNVGDMDAMRQVWHDVAALVGGSGAEQMDKFRSNLDKVPASVRPIVENLLDMNDAGLLTTTEFEKVIDAMTDLDQEAMGTAETIKFNAEQMEKGIPAAERTAEVMHDIATASDTTAGLDAQRDALARLAAQFPEVASAAGIAVGEVSTANETLAADTAKAVGELRNLADEFAKLADAPKSVDEANRRFLESQAAVTKSIAENGAGIDASTEAGRRNANAIQRMVEAGQRLAEAQALTDATGKTSRDTLNGLAASLASMRDAGKLTADEYEHLLDIYGLTPDRIETTVIASTADAQSNIDDLRAKFDGIKDDMSEPQQVWIQALIDQGKYAAAEAAINQIARERQVKINVKVGSVGESMAGLMPGVINVVGKRAAGGPVWPGTWLVGEDGPELLHLTPGQAGRVSNASDTKQLMRPEGMTLDPVLAELRSLNEHIRSSGGININVERIEATTPESTPRDLVRAAMLAKALI